MEGSGFLPTSGLAVHHLDASDIPHRLSRGGVPLRRLRDRHRAKGSGENFGPDGLLVCLGGSILWGTLDTVAFLSSGRRFGVRLSDQTRGARCSARRPLRSTEAPLRRQQSRGRIWSMSSHKRVCSLHTGSKGKRGLFMFSDNSSSRVYGLSHFGTQAFPHLFLNMTKNFKWFHLTLTRAAGYTSRAHSSPLFLNYRILCVSWDWRAFNHFCERVP